MAFSDQFFFLELYSGNATLARVFCKLFNIRSITIDWDEDSNADIKMDITKWNATTVDQVRRMAGGNHMRPIIWASPDCREYSRAKTTAARDLVGADARVAVVERIAQDLDAVVVLLENPATGLLPGRDVVGFLKHSYEVHYCAYGFTYRKPTMVWSSLPLPEFQPRTCQGYGNCLAMHKDSATARPRHVDEVNNFEYDKRISVPDLLAVSVASSVSKLVHTLRPQHSPPARKRSCKNEPHRVNFIRAAGVSDGVLMVEVHWVGSDAATWIPISNLDAHPKEYPYLHLDVREHVLSACRRMDPQFWQHGNQQQPDKHRRTGEADAICSTNSSGTPAAVALRRNPLRTARHY